MKVNKMALGKALGVMAMSWFALPIVYYLFCKKEVKKEENGKEESRRSDDQSEGAGSVC